MKMKTRRVVDAGSLYAEVGQLIKAERNRQQATQNAAAFLLGVSRTQLTNIERGASAVMLPHLYNLALAWGVPITRFLPKVTS